MYGDDRLFIDVRGIMSAALRPAVIYSWTDPFALGAEFVRWEIATEIAGELLNINPFDEPNVQQAKDATNKLLEAFKTTGSLPASPADATLPNGITLTAAKGAKRVLANAEPLKLLSTLKPGDYFAQLAYVSPSSPVVAELDRLRVAVRDKMRVATTLGVGPRYLHSTGQLHKGGPNTGVFLLFTAGVAEDLTIPGQPYTFGTLERAQALGDFASLDAANRRAIHVHLPSADPNVAREAVDAFIRAMSA